MQDFGYAGKYLSIYEGTQIWKAKVLSIFIQQEASVVLEKKYPDVSFYQGLIDWDKMRSMTDTVIIRAGQNVWIDTEFVRNYSESKSRGMRRGVYWFYDDRISPFTQASLLIELIKNDLPELEVFADWEKTYGGPYSDLSHVVEFMRLVEAGLSTVRVGMYTGYYWFKDHSSPTAHAEEYQYLSTKALWLAWYTSNPAYVLIPQPWSKITHWQYDTPAIGSQYGVQSGNIDMNYFNGTVAQFNSAYPISGTTPPEPGGTDYPFDGAVHTKLRRYNSDVHVIDTDPAKAHFEVYQSVSSIGKATVLAMAQKTGAQIAVNGGDYDPYTGDPTGLLAVNGVIKSPKEGYMPWLNISSGGQVTIEEWNSAVKPYNAVALRRMLVRDGKISTDTSAAWYERHPKTAYGVSATGHLIEVEADGRTDQSAGVTLFELAQLCIDAGCVRAADGGGGGDCTVVINGVVVNVPIADTTPGELRLVADAVLVFKQGGSGMGEGTAKEILNKTVTVRNGPSVLAGDTGLRIAAGGITNWVKIVDDTNHPNNAEYKWFQIDALGTKYCAYIYPTAATPTGERFTILTQPSGTPVGVPFTLTLTVQGFKDVTITGNLEPV